MRIELNSGGLASGAIIHEFQSNFDSLVFGSRKMVAAFQTIKSFTSNINGGIGSLQEAVDRISSRAQHDDSKSGVLESIQRKANSFVELARRIDLDVGGQVNRNKNEFYNVNPWSRPPQPKEEKKWYQKAWNHVCGTAGQIKDGINHLKDAAVKWGKSVADTLSKAWNNTVEWCKAHKEQIVKIAIATVVVVSLIALTAVTGPVGVVASAALQGALIGGAVGGAIGLGTGAYSYAKDHNGSLKGGFDDIFKSTVDGMLDGVITGAASGAASGVGFVSKSGTITKKLVTSGIVKSVGGTATKSIDYYFDNGENWDGVGKVMLKSAAVGFAEGMALESVSIGTGKLGSFIKNKYGKTVRFDIKLFRNATKIEEHFGSKYADIFNRESLKIIMEMEKQAVLSPSVMIKSLAQTGFGEMVKKSMIFIDGPKTKFVFPTGVKDMVKNGIKLFEIKTGIA